MPLGTFISTSPTLEAATDKVALADRLGYDSTYVTQFAGRDSLTALMAYAARTEQIKVGTGVLPIFSRTPVTTAQSAVTVDEFSGGRMVLGLGVSHQMLVENWHGQQIDKPVRQMREYVGAVRAMLRKENPPTSERFPTSFRFMSCEPRSDLPIYIGALSPAMLRLAGEIADGVILFLCSSDYIRDVVMPELAAGRERAGKSLDDFDVVAAVSAAVTEDPEAARNKLRAELVPYLIPPFYRAMLERSGFGSDLAAFDAAMGKGDNEAALKAMSDDLVGQLAAIGDAGEATASVRRYRAAGATSPCVRPISGVDEAATLEALADALSPEEPSVATPAGS